MAAAHFPPVALDTLRLRYVGKRLHELDGPAAVIDIARAERNCDAMLETARRLGLRFRAHVKTHKTTQLTRLQVGGEGPVNLIASTVAEIENLIPFMVECKAAGRDPNVIYGLPPSQSAVRRLTELARQLSDETSVGGIPLAGPAASRLKDIAAQPSSSSSSTDHGTHSSSAADGQAPIQFLVDHASQIEELRNTSKLWPFSHIHVFIKIDAGYHRCGIPSTSPTFTDLLQRCHGSIKLRGFYCHSGHSYSSSSASEAISYLEGELIALQHAADAAHAQDILASPDSPLILSAGATPTATSVQNLLLSTSPSAKTSSLTNLLATLQRTHTVEIHAGVYPLLDLQQLATHARPTNAADPAAEPSSAATVPPSPILPAALSQNDIALRILVEVSSVYTDRDKPEALISAGTLALGREPCKSYAGWGVVCTYLSSASSSSSSQSPSAADSPVQHEQKPGIEDEGAEEVTPIYSESSKTGWILGRISQEHGILTWEGDARRMRELRYGEKLLVWPNHACIAGAGFDWYLVVDSRSEDEWVVRDIWVRWRGW